MSMNFAVSYDSNSGIDYDFCFSTLREAYWFYNRLPVVPFKSLTFDHPKNGTITLLNSKGENNLKKYFCLIDYA